MKIFGLFLCAVCLACAAIDGTVHNGTTGKVQSGATVTLYKLSQNGLEQVESVKSDAQGAFRIESDLKGPRLIQTAYDGVTYNHMLPPGSPESGLSLDVYNASKRPGAAAIAQHMILLEPVRGELLVSETFVFQNDGKTTYNDPDGGTVKFFLPPAAKGVMQVNATAPQGMPIRRAADKTSTPDVYKVDFPIKPGETHIDVAYSLPFATGGTFASKVLHKDGATRLVVPAGVTVTGDGVEFFTKEPRTQASVYDVKSPSYTVQVAGTGSLRRPEAEAEDAGDSGPSFEQIQPKVYGNMTWILALTLTILALGFVLLYRTQLPKEAAAPPKEKNERRRG
jgi:hypothetical protein